MAVLKENNLFDKVKEIICSNSVVAPDDIHLDISLKDILDSLDAVSVTVELGKAFGTRIPPLNTVGDIVSFLQNKS